MTKRRKAQRQPAPQSSQAGVLRRTEITAASKFSGPLPPPETLAQYNDAVPGGAERILAMAETQSEHRMQLETRVVDADISRANWGLAAGFIVAVAGLGIAALLIDRGNSTAGVAIAAIDLVGLVGAFIYGTVSRRGERRERVEQMMGE